MSHGESGAIGFVGIGSMGWPMAAALVKAGFQVAVADAVAGRADYFAETVGGRAALDAADAASGASFIVTMLSTSQHVADVVRQNLDAFPPDSLIIDMSSGVPQITQDLAGEVNSKGISLVDCPVSGGVPRAQTGDLSIMAGGSSQNLDRAMPLLMTMGSAVQRCGDVGAGQAMKALNNLASAGGFLIGVEALLIGKAYGLEPSLMVDVLNSSSGMNNSTKQKFKQYVLSRSFDSGFGLDLMVKDLGIAIDVARDCRAVTPLATLCHQLWAAAANHLGPGLDQTDMARFSEDLSGVTLAEDSVVEEQLFGDPAGS